MGRMSTKRQRADVIVDRAEQLASSGRYDDWLSIEVALRFDYGLSEARSVLDNDLTRKRLNAMCEAARKKANEA